MNQAQGNRDGSQDKLQATKEHVTEGLRERVERARDVVDDLRERAEVAFRDRPYLVPVAAGALGLAVGMLLGSKLTRFIVFTAVGTVLSDLFGGELRRISREFVSDMQGRLGEGEGAAAAGE
jgi:ElaB/YqjD/DUF883 family membrane-anchored ribosome-binding protein